MSEREVRRHDLPDRELTGRARALVGEAEVTDRAERFAVRHEAVTEASDRRRRLRLLGWRALTVAVAVLAATVGVAVAGAPGVVAGALGGLVPVLRWAMLRAGRARGASAWDWRAQRHVLTRDASRDVQSADDPHR